MHTFPWPALLIFILPVMCSLSLAITVALVKCSHIFLNFKKCFLLILFWEFICFRCKLFFLNAMITDRCKLSIRWCFLPDYPLSYKSLSNPVTQGFLYYDWFSCFYMVCMFYMYVIICVHVCICMLMPGIILNHPSTLFIGTGVLVKPRAHWCG